MSLSQHRGGGILVFNCLVAILSSLLFVGDLHADVLKLPLSQVTAVGTVDLRCTSAVHNLSIPIPERWKIDRALLTFAYVNSTGLVASKSRLTIKVNGYPVAQITLNPSAPEGSVRLAIPTSLLSPGYNEVSFQASQHYALDSLECEHPCSSILWTTLKLAEASLELSYTLKPVPLKLSSMNGFVFDPKLHPHGEVHLVLENTAAEMVTIAGIVASGVARRFDYKSVLFTASQVIRPGVDNLVVGSRGFVQGLLQSQGLPPPEVNGPFLKILHAPGDVSHAVVVISGLDMDQLKLAAKTLAILSSSFPNSDELTATGFMLPDITMYGGRQVLTPSKAYTLKDLDFRSYTFKGTTPSPKDITFRLPADLLIKPNVYADLSLYFAYGAGLREDSAINLSLNGRLIQAIHLDDVRGAIISGYQIKVPTYMFAPGVNTLRFEPIMAPVGWKNCEILRTEILGLTLFENSTLRFPEMPHFTELPKLELFMLNGFPVTRWPDGHEAMVYLTKTDSDTIAAALDVIGLITQKNGYPLFEVTVTSTDPKQFDGELIVIGDIASIPEVYRKAGPLTLVNEATVPYPMSRSWAAEVAVAYSKQVSRFQPGMAALMQFLSPFTEGRSVLLLTTATTEDLKAAGVALMDPAVQAKIEGGLVLIELSAPDYPVTSLAIGKRYITGQTGQVSLLKRYLYVYPWFYYVAVTLVIAALSLLTFYLLLRFRKRRLKIEPAGPDG
jgi:hypothetical protein